MACLSVSSAFKANYPIYLRAGFSVTFQPYIYYVKLILQPEVSFQISLLKNTGHFTSRQKLNILPSEFINVFYIYH